MHEYPMNECLTKLAPRELTSNEGMKERTNFTQGDTNSNEMSRL